MVKDKEHIEKLSNLPQHIVNFLWNNITLGQTIFKNVFWLALGDGIVKIAKMIMFAFLARSLGVTLFGKFNFAFASVLIFVPLADFGVSTIFIRKHVGKEKFSQEMAPLFWLRIFSVFLILFFVFGYAIFFVKDLTLRKITYILGGYVALESILNLFFPIFRAQQKMQFQALFQTLEAILIALITILILPIRKSLTVLAWIYLLIRLILLICLGLMTIKRKDFSISNLSLTNDILERAKEYLLAAWPLGVAILLESIWNNSETLILGILKTNSDVGIYQAAYQIPKILFTGGTFIGIAFFPSLCFQLRNSFSNFKHLLSKFVIIMVGLGLILGMGCVYFSAPIIKIVYGSQYASSVLVLKFLGVVLFLNFLFLTCAYFLMIMGREKKYMVLVGLGTLINVVSGLILIPKFDIIGAALSKIISLFIFDTFIFYSIIKLFKHDRRVVSII